MSIKVSSTCAPLQNDSICPEASDGFVITPYIEEITNQALAYLDAGYPVHFAGESGTGKTTFAFHVAAQLGNPVTLVHGDDEFGSSDLVGKSSGYKKSKLVDNYVTSVLKTEEEMKSLWVDNRLTAACRDGNTLLYDEFNRSTPEANNVLLSVLSEGILNLPGLRSAGKGYLNVHPGFRAIFTSNPEEYAGTHKTQDALMDRMITIKLDHPDRDTEVAIVAAKAGISQGDAVKIVDLVREIRGAGEYKRNATIRAGIAIGRILEKRGGNAQADDQFFQRLCYDVLSVGAAKVLHDGKSVLHTLIDESIRKIYSPKQERIEIKRKSTVSKAAVKAC